MAAPQLPAQELTPADVTAQAAEETFDLRVSGNVYYDKLPVQGAEVTIYLNGRQVGKTTAGDIYNVRSARRTGWAIRYEWTPPTRDSPGPLRKSSNSRA
jgi:hypothetical protein